MQYSCEERPDGAAKCAMPYQWVAGQMQEGREHAWCPS